MKNEYPSPETILTGEVAPGRCRRAPTIESAKGKKTLCWSNKAAGQERVWCMARQIPKDSSCKKDRRTAATVQRPAAFRKTQPDLCPSLTERPPKRKKFFSEFETPEVLIIETVCLQILRRPAPCSSTPRWWRRYWACPSPPPTSCSTIPFSPRCVWGAVW